MRQPIPTPESIERAKQTLRVCASCPFLKSNHRKPHPAKWYQVANLRRLWNGLRTGNAPGMICHSSDPKSAEYGGSGNIQPGKEHECAGALILQLVNMNALAASRPQPHQPPLTRARIADIAWLYMTGTLPAVENRADELGLPWERST